MDKTETRNTDAKLDESVSRMSTLAKRNAGFATPIWLLTLLIVTAALLYFGPALGLKRYVDQGGEKIARIGSQAADKIAVHTAPERQGQKAGTGQGAAAVDAKRIQAPLSGGNEAAPATKPAIVAKAAQAAPTAAQAAAPATPAVAAQSTGATDVARTGAPELLPNVAARIAARNLEFGLAIRLYETYLDANPGDADAWGELGNVQMAVGRHYEAAQNYYEASIRQLNRGHAATVYPLLPIIAQYQPELAAALRQRMTGAGI